MISSLCLDLFLAYFHCFNVTQILMEINLVSFQTILLKRRLNVINFHLEYLNLSGDDTFRIMKELKIS